MARLRPRHPVRWLLGGAVALAVLVVGGTWLYIHAIEGPAPAPLGLRSGSSPGAGSGTAGPSGAANAASAAVAGQWKVASGSVVGYRVQEVLAGQNNTAVGRTSDITGGMTISGATVTAASFTVKMATVHSDQSERDAQFDGRIMDTASYPTGTLTLSTPIDLGTLPSDGAIRTYQATAKLTLHGDTRTVAFGLQGERTSTGIEVSGSIPIVFADYGIANPSFAGFVTTQDHGLLEFLVKFSRA
jgi:polyisoprenoid-binding protein YceI